MENQEKKINKQETHFINLQARGRAQKRPGMEFNRTGRFSTIMHRTTQAPSWCAFSALRSP